MKGTNASSPKADLFLCFPNLFSDSKLTFICFIDPQINNGKQPNINHLAKIKLFFHGPSHKTSLGSHCMILCSQISNK